MKEPAPKRLWAMIAFPLLVAALVVPVVLWHDDLWKVFGSVRRIRTWIDGWGSAAPLAFMAVQTLQVIVFAIPGEVVQIAGGYLFGGWWAILLSLGGIAVGSSAAFFLARLLGRPFVASIVRPERLQPVEKLLESRSSRTVFFLLFLIPGIPKDILCYVAGLTPMRFPYFLGISLLGRLPGIVGSSVIGGAARTDRWILMGIISAIALLLFAAGIVFRPRLQALVERITTRKQPPPAS